MKFSGVKNMKVHISLNVSSITESVEFYSRMLAAEPVKFFESKETDGIRVGGYAKFDIADPPLNLALNENKVVKGGNLSHLGLQVESTEKVLEFKDRWEEADLTTSDEMDVTCCYAKQDKTWVRDPDGNEWEAFVVLSNVESMDPSDSSCCNVDAAETKSVELNPSTRVGSDTKDTVKASACC